MLDAFLCSPKIFHGVEAVGVGGASYLKFWRIWAVFDLL